jgi:hypothetical protein
MGCPGPGHRTCVSANRNVRVAGERPRQPHLPPWAAPDRRVSVLSLPGRSPEHGGAVPAPMSCHVGSARAQPRKGQGPENCWLAHLATAGIKVVACGGGAGMEGALRVGSGAENAENAEFSKPLRFRQTKFYWANRLVSRATPGRSSAFSAFSALHPIGRRSRSASRSCVILRLRAPVRRAPRSPDPFARFVSRSAFADLVHGAVLERRRWLGGHSRHVDPF